MAASQATSFSLDELLGKSVESSYERTQTTVVVRGLSVATWRYRSRTATSVGQTMVGVHGGPAFGHSYILPLLLLCDRGYDVVLYDQAGCGASALPDPAAPVPSWLLTVEYYWREELPAVLEAHGLKHAFLYGSSWGTIVGQLFAIADAGRPEEQRVLRGLILDGALSDAQLYIRTQWRDNLSKLPLLTQERLRLLEAEKATSSPCYKAIESALTSMFTHRLLPPAQCFLDSVASANMSIYIAMQGPSEFAIGGMLANFKCTEELAVVKAPTLVLRGEYDTMTEECSLAIVNAIPHCMPLVTIPRAGHCKLCDEPHECARVMGDFLDRLL